MKKFVPYIYCFSVLLLSISCRKNLDPPHWDVKALTPIIRTSVSIENLIDSSDVLEVDENNQINIVYEDSLYQLDPPLDELIDLSIDPFETIFTIDQLELGDQSINDSIFLEEFSVVDGIPFIGEIVIPDTSEIDNVLLGFLGEVSETIPINISDFFEEAVLNEAYFDLTIHNSTGFDLVNLNYSIENADDGLVLITNSIPRIEAGELYTDLNQNLIDQIGDNAIKGDLNIILSGITLELPANQASTFFYYSDFLAFDVTLRDLSVVSAKAQFPAQEIVNQTNIADLNAENDVQITFMRIDTGIVNLKAFSTIPTDVHVDYTIHGLSKDGETFNLQATIDNEFSSSLNQKDTNFFFNIYDFDVTAPGYEYNAIESSTIGTIDATDGIIDLSLEDTIGVEIEVTKIKPSYVRGFIGMDTTNIQDTIDIELIDGISGNINFSNISLEIEIDNQIGVENAIYINNLTAINSATGQTETFTGVTGPYSINPAQESGENYVEVKSILNIEGTENLLSILPDQIAFDLDIIINPNGNDGTYSNFIHSGAGLNSTININIPLEISGSSITLSDTIDFSETDIEYPEGYKGGTLTMLVDNGFPLDAGLELYFYSIDSVKTDSLISDDVVLAAETDPLTGEVSQNTESTIVFENITESRLQNILSAETIIVNSQFESSSLSNIKILSSYTLDLQLLGDFTYNTKKLLE